MIVYFKWMPKVWTKGWEQVQEKITLLDDEKRVKLFGEKKEVTVNLDQFYKLFKRS